MKHLRLAPRSVDGVCVIDGWMDYPRFERSVKDSIRPQDEIPNLVPDWWASLGATG